MPADGVRLNPERGAATAGFHGAPGLVAGKRVVTEAMNEPDQRRDSQEAIEEAAEHADRASEEREEMRRKASLAETTDDARRAGGLAREAEEHKEEAYEQEGASADRAHNAD